MKLVYLMSLVLIVAQLTTLTVSLPVEGQVTLTGVESVESDHHLTKRQKIQKDTTLSGAYRPIKYRTDGVIAKRQVYTGNPTDDTPADGSTLSGAHRPMRLLNADGKRRFPAIPDKSADLTISEVQV
ncbi:hypothetical protein BKA69DRAFT_1053217 [Paraphysoderma sedebokerense]|nr:hypothetical protein BKA69DRAFT_1053217 [Paraphysoderma sedebokerense]